MKGTLRHHAGAVLVLVARSWRGRTVNDGGIAVRCGSTECLGIVNAGNERIDTLAAVAHIRTINSSSMTVGL